jgi:2-phospho-L-lactate transferase/gluconeogenesis factor (CofD/UPF0052 family)
MNNKYSNPCFRCGRERIVSKTVKEKIGESVIETTLTVCPDPACQKEVDRENKRISDKKRAMQKKSEERAVARRAAKAAERDALVS